MWLGSKEIEKLIIEKNLVKDYINLEDQLQPDGFDLTVNRIEAFAGRAIILTDSKLLPPMVNVETNDANCFELDGLTPYIIYFNEEIKLPEEVSSIHIQRSTTMRCGDIICVGTWDRGYNGKGCTMIFIANPFGLTLQKKC